ncbi:phage tail protein [Aerococcus mictus]|uniref:Phage tail protein n=1 Tax=Aerococcus mictus TaxID=2976810 RepID=A0ABZ2EB16_9LACT|nr:phage tail protein [Aerococcus mictus]MDL5175121.1 phage tail protein [Aerococcus mictus]
MLHLIDEKGKGHGALAEIKETNGVNGEKSLSGVIYTNDEVIDHLDIGWKVLWKEERYPIIFAQPIDLGERVELHFDAVHEFFYDMSKSSIETQLSDGSHTMDAYLHFIFSGTPYSYSLNTKVKAFQKQSFGYKNRLALFNDVIKTAGVEFSVNGSVINITDRVGNDLSTIVKKGFNLNELKIEKKIGEFITYKAGFGKYHDEEDHSKGRIQTSYTSPLAKIYGRRDGDPIVDERYTNVDNLKARLKEEVDNSYNIAVNLTMEDLTKAGYQYKQPRAGDQIMAINKDLHFERKVRIVSYTSIYDTNGDLVEHEISCNSISMAQAVTSSQSDVKQQLDNIREQLELTQKAALNAQVSADHKNNIYYGSDRPDPNQLKINVGDIWFDSSGEDTVIKVWNGVEWRIAGFDAEAQKRIFDELNRKLKAMDDQIAASNKRADSIYKEATGAKTLAVQHEKIIKEIQGADKKQDQLIKSLSERSTIDDEVQAEFISNKELIRYSDNRWLGETTGYLPPNACLRINHNGNGYLPGKEYTVSIILYQSPVSDVQTANTYVGVSVATEIERSV